MTPQPKKPGRPRNAVPTQSVTYPVKFDTAEYDGLCVIARRRGMVIHAAIKLAVRQMIERESRISGGIKTPVESKPA